MQYGYCVVKPTPGAISSLYFTGIAPSAMATLSKAQKAFMPFGAFASRSFNLARFFMSYMDGPPNPWSYAMHLRQLMFQVLPNVEKRANYNCSMLVKIFDARR